MVEIDHLVVLALENRSFDHLLGYIDHPDPAFDGLRHGGPYTNPGWNGVGTVAATPNAKSVLPVGPDHSHDAVMEQLGLAAAPPGSPPTNQGFVTSYERICRGLSPPAFGGLLGPLANWWVSRNPPTPPVRGRGPLAMESQDPSHVPVLSTLATSFAACTSWFCSVPGETWPNRNFMHAATSDGETDINPRFYTNKTIFELLEEHGRDWHIYYDDTPQVWAFANLWDSPDRIANWYEFAAFDAHVRAGKLPAYSFIEPNHKPVVHTMDYDPVVGSPDLSDNQHPGNNLVSNSSYDAAPAMQDGDFKRGESLIASVYQSLRGNPDLFNRTILLITYDEHGGLFDHVPPPTGVPNPGSDSTWLRRIWRAIYTRKAAAFDFSILGPRVPAIVVSPYVDAGTISTHTRDHASIPSTLRALFAPGAPPLTSRDDWAAPFHCLLRRTAPRTDLPDLSGQPGAVVHSEASARPAAAPPDHYQPYVALADSVRQQLDAAGVPEALGGAGMAPYELAGHASRAFSAAAQRARAGQVNQGSLRRSQPSRGA
jgi:phospholipase C